MEQPNYFSIITADVRYDKRLKANEKLLYSEITALSNKYGYCLATNRYFADLYGVNPPTVSGWIQDLIKFGYIRKEIKRKENQEVLYRHLFINNLPTKNKGGVPHKNVGPGLQKMKDNITSINNTRSNSSCSNDDAKHAISQYWQKEFKTVTNGVIEKYISNWVDEFGYDLLKYYIDYTLENQINRSHVVSYLKEIFKRCREKGIHTVEDAKKAEAEYKSSKEKPRYRNSKKEPEYKFKVRDEGLTQQESLAIELKRIKEEERKKGGNG